MGSLVIAAKGTLLKMGDGGGPEVFTTIAEVSSIGGPNMSANTIDSTTHDSTGPWMDAIPSLLNPGDLSLNINYVPTNSTQNASTGLIRDFKNRTRRNFQLVWPDVGATTWAVTGFVTAFQPNAPVADKLSATVTIKLVGQPTLV